MIKFNTDRINNSKGKWTTFGELDFLDCFIGNGPEETGYSIYWVLNTPTNWESVTEYDGLAPYEGDPELRGLVFRGSPSLGFHNIRILKPNFRDKIFVEQFLDVEITFSPEARRPDHFESPIKD